MPLARYFLWVGSVLFALLFVADACFPKLPAVQANIDTSPVLIRIHSVQKWPERVVLDSRAPMPRVIVNASPLQADPSPQTAAVIPDRVRNALAQLQTSDVVPTQAASPKRQEAVRHRQQRAVNRRVARPMLPMARQQPQYAWFGSRMWW
jgi:hypothetical protein